MSTSTPVVNADNTQQTVTTSSNQQLTTPVVVTSGNLQVGTGATGTFTSLTGQIITVADGIIINIF